MTTPRVPILNIFSPILADTIDQHMLNVARPRGLPGMNPGHPCVLFAEVVTQMGIEPVTKRCLVVVLTTKLLGHLFIYGRRDVAVPHRTTKPQNRAGGAMPRRG